MLTKFNLTEKPSLFDDHWRPRLVGELDGQEVKHRAPDGVRI